MADDAGNADLQIARRGYVSFLFAKVVMFCIASPSICKLSNVPTTVLSKIPEK